MMMRSWWTKVRSNPAYFQKVNGWLTIVWFIAAFPICLFLANSVPFLVFISVYAVVTGHLATWQAARVETTQAHDAARRDDDVEQRIEVKVDSLRKVVDRH